MTISLRTGRAAWPKATTLAAVLALFIALNAPQALATHVKCGDVITEDTRLDSDLINCPGNGIMIGADNITLDVNGHTIDGDGDALGTGIANGRVENFTEVDAHRHVNVERGVVQQFGVGVQLRAGADHNVVRGLAVLANFRGIEVGSSSSLIARTRLSTNIGPGISIGGAANDVRRNVASNNGTGIELDGFGDGNVIEKNVLTNNGTGISLSDSFGDSLVRKNRIVDSAFSGIFLGESQNALIEKNWIFGSGADGIRVDDDSSHNVVVRNVANRNGDDGIDVDDPRSTLTKNTANHNGDLGIEAVPGVTDGGGNKARGNGNPLQCLNIDCK